MTKKDFELIAGTLLDGYNATMRNEMTTKGYEIIVDLFNIRLKNTNPRFDERKFKVACGVGV